MSESKTSCKAGLTLAQGSTQTQECMETCICEWKSYKWMGKDGHFSQWCFRSLAHLALLNSKFQLEITRAEYLYDIGTGKDFLNKMEKEQ